MIAMLQLSSLVFVITVFSVTPAPVSGATYNDSDRLYADMIDSYDYRIRPVKNQSEQIIVYVRFYLSGILNIDEITQQMDLNAWMNFTWVDELRTWDPQNYGGLHMLHPYPKDIWLPRVFISNAVANRDPFGDEYSPSCIFSDGVTNYYVGALFSVFCGVDIRYFPFDTQTCSITFMAINFGSELLFVADPPTAINDIIQENGEWEVIDTKIVTSRQMGDVMVCDVSFQLKRRPTYFIVNVLVPIMCMSGLSSLVFVLPEDSGERASFSVTLLLATSLYLSMVSEKLPHSSVDLPIIVNYLFSLLILCGFTVLVTVVQLRLAQRRNKIAPDEKGTAPDTYQLINSPNSFGNENAQQKQFPHHRHNRGASFTQLQPVSRLEVVCYDKDVQAWGSDNKQKSFSMASTDGNTSQKLWDANVHTKSSNGSQSFEKFKYISSSCSPGFAALLKYPNVMLFIFMNALWLVLTIYFLAQLVNY